MVGVLVLCLSPPRASLTLFMSPDMLFYEYWIFELDFYCADRFVYFFPVNEENREMKGLRCGVIY